MAIFRETGDRHSQGRALDNLGFAYQEMGRLEEAITCHQQAVAIFRETGDRYSEGMALDNLGIAYQEMRQSGRAAAYWPEAASAMRDVGDHEQAALLEQKAANAQSRWRRWLRHPSRSSEI